MKVVVTRSGGFAGLVRSAEVDDPAEAQGLVGEVRRAAERPAEGRARDGFSYQFVVVTSESRETYSLTDAQLDATLSSVLRTLF